MNRFVASFRTAFAPRRATARARHRGRSLVALALAIAVPAFAAPAEWRAFPLFESAKAEPVRPMGYEIAGESFPGSAFYYLADEPNSPPVSAAPEKSAMYALLGDAEDSAAPAIARAMTIHGSATDKARALRCMTMAIYYEAASESDAGQRAVAQVVLNRVAHPAFPATVCGVVFQGSERSTGCQFSFTCDGSLTRAPVRQFWDRAQRVAMAALAGAVYQPVGLATHYHTVQIHPYWADSLTNIVTIGAHRFYRWKGVAGLPVAFNEAYAGSEPLPERRTPTGNPDAQPLPDPIQLAQSYVATLAAAHPSAQPQHGATAVAAAVAAGAGAAAPLPSYTAEIQARGGEALYTGNRLPGAGEVKSEYARSGQWIAHP